MNNSIREKQLGTFGKNLPKNIKTKQNKPRNALDKPKYVDVFKDFEFLIN
jgi:hypothetical protein